MILRALLPMTMLLLSSAARAEAPRIIRFGLTGDYPPYAQRQPDGSFQGADVTIARKIAHRLKAEAIFVPTSWATLSTDLTENRFDIAIGGLTVTPERAAIGTYSVTLLNDGKRPLARCEDAGRYRTLAQIDRTGVRVQINRGPAIGALSKQWFHAATVTVNADDADLVPALLDRRSDVWITDGVVVDHMARRYQGRLCATTLQPFTHQEKAWLIRKDEHLVAAVNKELKRTLSDGSWIRALKAER